MASNTIHRTICTCAAVLVIGVYSILSIASIQGSYVRLNSPDETANYFFSRTFAQTSAIGYNEPLLEPTKGIVHPRSMTTAGDRVAPVGFLGLTVLYGSLGKAFGSNTILFFTPIIAVISALVFYAFLAQIFSRRVAGLSAVLLLIHPAYWYYASRGMLPNILFLDFLVLAAFVLVTAYRRERRLLYLVGGICAGLALTVRLSEILWIGVALLIAALVMLGRKVFIPTLFFILGAALPLAGLFAFNTSVYGHPFIFGYQSTATYESVASLDRLVSLVKTFDTARVPEMREALSQIIEKGRIYIFPFGFNAEAFTAHFHQYGLAMFWWFTLPTLFGILIVLKQGLYELFRERRRGLIVYVIVSAIVGTWLVVYYGSWTFTDNISEEVTIGNSYVRYWLPLYLLSLPLCASTLAFFLRGTRGLVSRVLIVSAIVVVMMFFSGRAVLYEYRDSLFPVAQNIEQYQRSAEWIVRMTPSDAVIVSQRSDKNFFPERRVAQSFPEFVEKEFLSALAARVPVYYYGMWNDEDAAYISRRYFSEYDLALEAVAPFENGERLYRVVSTEEL